MKMEMQKCDLHRALHVCAPARGTDWIRNPQPRVHKGQRSNTDKHAGTVTLYVHFSTFLSLRTKWENRPAPAKINRMQWSEFLRVTYLGHCSWVSSGLLRTSERWCRIHQRITLSVLKELLKQRCIALSAVCVSSDSRWLDTLTRSDYDIGVKYVAEGACASKFDSQTKPHQTAPSTFTYLRFD